MPKLTTVRFVRPWRAYNAGERAGFPDDVAADLVANGVGLYVDDVDQLKAAARSDAKGLEEPDEPEGDALSGLSWHKLKSLAAEVARELDEDFIAEAGGQQTENLLAYLRSRLTDADIDEAVDRLTE